MSIPLLRTLTLATGLAAPATQASLVINGGFEQGLTGWDCKLNKGHCSTPDWYQPQEGMAHFWGYDNGTGGVISQSLATHNNTPYRLSLFYGSFSAEPLNHLFLSFGDLHQALPLPQAGWLWFSAQFTASQALKPLSFSFDTNIGSDSLWLDAIQVEPLTALSEAGTWGLLALGLTGLGLARNRAHRKSTAPPRQALQTGSQ